MPTIASGESGSLLRSTTSWAMRTIARATSSRSSTTFSAASNFPRPSWPHRTRLKDVEKNVAASSDRLNRGLAEANERRLAAVGERNLDPVEVAGQLAGGEHRARLLAKLAPRVTRRDVRQREQLDLGVGRDLGGLRRGGVSRQLSAL